MGSRKELEGYLEQYLAVGEFKDYGPNGLQVQGSEDIQHIGVAVSACLASIEAAVDLGVQALLVHHGLFWNRDDYCITGSKYQKIKLLIDNGISLFAYHLPLDAHPEVGNNWKAAQDLGWQELEPFALMNGQPIGVRGKLPGVPLEEFQRQLETYYEHPAHGAYGGPPQVHSAALVSGGANKVLVEAVQAGVDAFITGSFDEPQWHMAHEEGIHFFAMGHSHTERVGPQALGKHLETKMGLRVSFIDTPNPF